MASQGHPTQADGQCLRYPDPIPPQREINYETAVGMLMRAAGTAQNVPFVWSYVDKPQDGTVLLLYLPLGNPFPNDGIRYQDSEIKAVVPAGGGRELEVCEIKYGFIPGAGEPSSSRLRRRYRLQKGGHPQLVLVHYTRGPMILIPPGIANQPVRAYPLRALNEPSVYVAGEKQGQKMYPPGMGPGAMHAGGGGPASMAPGAMGMPMNFSQQQAMLAQQNSQMEALERRRERERERERAAQRDGQTAGRPPQGRIPDDDDSGDEVDQISTRTLAMARYKRNHEWMNEVFHRAAFGDRAPKPKSTPYSIFSKSELEEKTAKLQTEIEALQASSAKRRADKIRESQSQPSADITMSSIAGDSVAA
ncbi:unnamed protein product [Cyclocybe aegerita]|uniref:SWI/SNF and RSC complexes subunit ssr4 n=1 Tax=Cyclocybe aegerita TaxID=1973307 RepID=A0A8S0WGE6_CYCAE|nr:unnamed protein product [Cyclocybe aegerita]